MIIDNLSLSEAAKITLSNRLFVNGWNLRAKLVSAIKHPDKYEKDIIHLYKYENKFIGVIYAEYVDNLDAYVCEFFVRKSHRRKGIATELFNSLKGRIENKMFSIESIGLDYMFKIKHKQIYAYGFGIKNSDKFFKEIELKEEPEHDRFHR